MGVSRVTDCLLPLLPAGSNRSLLCIDMLDDRRPGTTWSYGGGASMRGGSDVGDASVLDCVGGLFANFLPILSM